MFCEINVFKNSQENISAGVSFLTKLMAGGLQLYLKRASYTGEFLWISRNLYRTSSGDCVLKYFGRVFEYISNACAFDC